MSGSKLIPLKAGILLLYRVTEAFLMASPDEMLKFVNILVGFGSQN